MPALVFEATQLFQVIQLDLNGLFEFKGVNEPTLLDEKACGFGNRAIAVGIDKSV